MNRMMYRSMPKVAGFTLVELLIVLTIIGILLAAAISSYQLARIRSRDSRRISDLRQIETALALYEGRQHKFPVDIYAAPGADPAGLSPDFMPVVPREPLGAVAYAYAISADRLEYHLGATMEDAQSAARDSDSDFSSVVAGWAQGFAGDDAAGPCLATQAGSFCYDIVELK
ncbi:type II secretion system protein [Candidatus Parcubacteria bacterium]|nr:type II secretion system protein [Candidatus Parcubacteria bacterium]